MTTAISQGIAKCSVKSNVNEPDEHYPSYFVNAPIMRFQKLRRVLRKAMASTASLTPIFRAING